MFDNVIIGIDGAQGGQDAIALAQQLVSDQGTLTLAHVHGGYPMLSKRSCISPLLVIEECERAEELLTKTAAELERDASVDSIGVSSVGDGLHDLAEQRGADLLVVGSTSRGRLGRALRDDTRAALDGAPCAVAIAPAGYADRAKPVARIGVALKDSPESRHALTVARRLGARFGAKLSACEVLITPTYVYLGVIPSAATTGDRLADRFEAGLLDGIEFHVRYGFPADELGDYSRSVDLLVAGSRGHEPLGRLMHGSTTAQLTRTCRCPLLVLTRSSTIEPEHDHTGRGDVAATS